MISSPLFRFFLPTGNPLGFSGIDFIVLGVAALVFIVFAIRARVLAIARALSGRTVLCMLLLAAVPIILRLALLVHYPVPAPQVSDDFSYLLLGDTLAHFRLTNPMHPLHRFFEGVFVIQDPSYSSIFPLGQGLVLAFGQLVFRQPWAGVVISVGALCAFCYWMLRAWVSPVWALCGGFLAVIEFGPLSSWMNTYWGGAVSGIAGCLVFGALPRLRRHRRTRDAVLLGAGLGLQLLTRPFEFLLLVAVVVLFFVPVRSLAVAALVVLPAAALTLMQNKEVTGSWITLPYQLSRYQYGIPTTFVFQANPIPHRPLTIEQQIDYDAQSATHGKGVDTPWSYFARLGSRVRFYRFFLLAPLYFALLAFLLALKQYRFLWVLMALALFWLGDAFYPFFYPHYIAAVACLLLLAGVKGLELLSGLRVRRFLAGQEAVTVILGFCLGHFIFWYGLQLDGNVNLTNAFRAAGYWDWIESGDRERAVLDRRLANLPGRQLVFVRYWPRHGPVEWIHDAADIDGSPVVWAIDLGTAEDEILRRYYPDRQAWLLEPDAHPPRLTPYQSDPATASK